MNSDRYLALIGYEWRLKTPLELAKARRRQEREEWLASVREEWRTAWREQKRRRPIDDNEIPF